MKSVWQAFLGWCAERGFRPGRFALVVVISWVSVGSDWLSQSRLTKLSYDALMSMRSGAAPANVAIVYMNQQTLVQLGAHPDGTLSRTNYARLLDKLANAKPNVVVLDLILSGTNVVAGEDELLARAITNHGKVILSSAFAVGAVGAARLSSITPPTMLLRKAASAWGHAGLDPDSDRVVRVMSRDTENAKYIATLACERFTQMAPAHRAPRWLNYYGAPQDKPFLRYPLEAVLDVPGVPASAFSNKVVFVGSKWEAGVPGQLLDSFWTPYGQESPGLEVHATATANLLNNETLREVPLTSFALIWSVLLAVVVSWPRRFIGAVLAAACALLLFALAFILHAKANLFLPWAVCAFVQAPCALLARLWLNPKLNVIGFISYRREDSAYAQLILDHLQARGYSAYLDREIQPGRFWSQLEHKIRTLPVFILIITDRTFPFVQRGHEEIMEKEIVLALALNKPIVPLRAIRGSLSEVLPESVSALRAFQDVEYNHRSVPASMKEMTIAILRAARGASSRPDAVQPPAQVSTPQTSR